MFFSQKSKECNFEGERAVNIRRRSRRNVSPTRKMGKGTFIPQEIMGGLGNRGMQDFFVIFFLRRQNDVVSKESQTLFCPEEEMFEGFFHERNMKMLS